MATTEVFASATAELLADWRRRCRESQCSHYAAADRLFKRNRYIGIPAVVLSAVLGTGVLASQHFLEPGWRIFTGLIGVSAAVLTALQINLNLSERAERHRSAGARFAGVRREIEQLLTLGPEADGGHRRDLDRIRERMDALAEQSPTLPPDLWDKPPTA